MSDERRYWLDRPENVTRLYRGLWLIGIGLVTLDLAVHRHEEWRFAETFAFFGVYGFIACVALVLTAKGLRRLLMRREDYYDER